MPRSILTPMRNELTRRAFVAGLGAVLALPLLPRGAVALTTGQATTLVQALVDDINAVIASGRSEAAMLQDFAAIFAKYSDSNIIARSCLGPDARRFSSGELQAYANAFRGYVGRKYGKRFHDFVGGRIEVQDAQAVKSWVEVRTLAILRNEAPFEVRFLVSDKAGRPLFFDMLVEGISLRLTEKTEMGALLDRNGGSIAKVTEALKSMG